MSMGIAEVLSQHRKAVAAQRQHVTYEGAMVAAADLLGGKCGYDAIAQHYAADQLLKLSRRLTQRIACYFAGRCVCP